MTSSTFSSAHISRWICRGENNEHSNKQCWLFMLSIKTNIPRRHSKLRPPCSWAHKMPPHLNKIPSRLWLPGNWQAVRLYCFVLLPSPPTYLRSLNSCINANQRLSNSYLLPAESGCKGEWDNITCWERADVGDVVTIQCPKVLRTLFGSNGAWWLILQYPTILHLLHAWRYITKERFILFNFL